MAKAAGRDTLNTRRRLKVGNRTYDYYSIKAAEKSLGDLSRLPNSMKVLLENLLRHEDGRSVTVADIKAIAKWLKTKKSKREIAYRPARVLMQDFTGVPAVADLAAMRSAVADQGGDPQSINPLSQVDLVIDHSVMVDSYGTAGAAKANVAREYERNRERYEFLRWGQDAFDNFRVVPPGAGICHQVNLEFLAEVVWTKKEGKTTVAYPDTLVGTDSHTTMVNGLAVLGWGVGGIEAEAAMLGQPISMLLPEVIGVRLSGRLREGATATDLVLTVVERLRQKGVVGKFVEFFGPGIDDLALADRATLSNMAPEYGATCGFFSIDSEAINYLTTTGRKPAQVALIEKYAKAQGMWWTSKSPDPVFTSVVDIDVSKVEPSLAGPKRPQDRVKLSDAAKEFEDELPGLGATDLDKVMKLKGSKNSIGHGAIVIAAITSCTNTSNPGVMLGAGLLAQNAVKKGLKVKPWVKTSLAPGSKVVTEYFKKAGVQKDLDKLGFNTVGYGCTTCIGNSGPLPDDVSDLVNKGDLVAVSVLSGNRNFEGRISPQVKANYLASPMLVVAYALVGTMKADIVNQPLGNDKKGNPVYLRDIWPSSGEIQATIRKAIGPAMFRNSYAEIFKGDANWRKIRTSKSVTYNWDSKSTYVKKPPFFEDFGSDTENVADVTGARLLALLGDSITTDHISPAGSIAKDGPAGDYLIDHKVKPVEFNSFGARRGNHDVMMRGTFGNIRLRNLMAPGTEGGITRFMPKGTEMPIYDAAIKYKKAGTPLVVVAGKEYGTGSSRDWAAKGTLLLGVKAVIVESFERIHRSNLVGMGVLPLQFTGKDNRKTLKLDGSETFDLTGISGGLKPGMEVKCTVHYAGGKSKKISLLCRIDTLDEVEYFRSGGILQYVLGNLIEAA